VPLLFVFALAVAFFAIRALHVLALLLRTARLGLARLALLGRRLVVRHEDTSGVARPCDENARAAATFREISFRVS
jgi:hypothetical protein